MITIRRQLTRLLALVDTIGRRCFVAGLAERSPIAQLKAQFRELCERLDMVGVNTNLMAFAGTVAAQYARPVVALKNRLTPRFVFGRVANAKMFGGDTALPVGVSRPEVIAPLVGFPSLAQRARRLTLQSFAVATVAFWGANRILESCRNSVAGCLRSGLAFGPHAPILAHCDSEFVRFNRHAVRTVIAMVSVGPFDCFRSRSGRLHFSTS